MEKEQENEVIEPIKSLRTDSLRVSIIDNNDQEIWAYGYKDGFLFGVSDKTLNFNRIVEIIELALEQAKGELSISKDKLLPSDNSDRVSNTC